VKQRVPSRAGIPCSTISVVNYLVKVGDHTTPPWDDISLTASTGSGRRGGFRRLRARRPSTPKKRAQPDARSQSRSLHSATKIRFLQDQFSEIPRRPRLRSSPCTLDSLLERTPESVRASIATPVLEWHDPALSWHRVHLNAAGVETMQGDVDLQTPSNGDTDARESIRARAWGQHKQILLGLPDVTGKWRRLSLRIFRPDAVCHRRSRTGTVHAVRRNRAGHAVAEGRAGGRVCALADRSRDPESGCRRKRMS
jgi:hypothetical protein